MEIPDPPGRTECADCGPLVWLWSPRRSAWVAFVPAPAGGAHAIRPHPCRSAQDPATWRDLRATPAPEQFDINARGRRLVEREIKPSTTTGESQ
jgi:hypothetical protein